jgi:hypothetical protein
MRDAMARRVKPRRRGRPPNEDRVVADQIIIDMAAALTAAYGLGPQRARDFALALLEGKIVRPTRLPRGAGKVSAASVLASHRLPKTVTGRHASVVRNLKSGKVRSRPDVVAGMVRILRAKDTDLIHLLLRARHIYESTSKIESVP